MEENNITILKYRVDSEYFFHVMDKFDEPDEAERLAKMMQWSRNRGYQCQIDGREYEQLWIKTTPIV